MMRKRPSPCAGFVNWRNRLLNSQVPRGAERIPKPTRESVLFNVRPRFGLAPAAPLCASFKRVCVARTNEINRAPFGFW
jgi:hypothetical protein